MFLFTKRDIYSCIYNKIHVYKYYALYYICVVKADHVWDITCVHDADDYNDNNVGIVGDDARLLGCAKPPTCSTQAGLVIH
jgi:hypothetical protein